MDEILLTNHSLGFSPDRVIHQQPFTFQFLDRFFVSLCLSLSLRVCVSLGDRQQTTQSKKLTAAFLPLYFPTSRFAILKTHQHPPNTFTLFSSFLPHTLFLTLFQSLTNDIFAQPRTAFTIPLSHLFFDSFSTEKKLYPRSWFYFFIFTLLSYLPYKMGKSSRLGRAIIRSCLSLLTSLRRAYNKITGNVQFRLQPTKWENKMKYSAPTLAHVRAYEYGAIALYAVAIEWTIWRDSKTSSLESSTTLDHTLSCPPLRPRLATKTRSTRPRAGFPGPAEPPRTLRPEALIQWRNHHFYSPRLNQHPILAFLTSHRIFTFFLQSDFAPHAVAPNAPNHIPLRLTPADNTTSYLRSVYSFSSHPPS